MTVAEWFDAVEEGEWDRQMEMDFSRAGRGNRLLQEVEADIAAGRTKPMEEFWLKPKPVANRASEFWLAKPQRKSIS
jgi:hypothetical protein